MNYSFDEKLAIIRVLEKMAKADNQFAPEEMDFLMKVASILDIDSKDIYESKDMPLKDAGKIIDSMTEGKKDLLRTMLVDMAIADGRIDISELKVLIDTFLWVEFPANDPEDKLRK